MDVVRAGERSQEFALFGMPLVRNRFDDRFLAREKC
jgi:hypothetical protein